MHILLVVLLLILGSNMMLVMSRTSKQLKGKEDQCFQIRGLARYIMIFISKTPKKRNKKERIQMRLKILK